MNIRLTISSCACHRLRYVRRRRQLERLPAPADSPAPQLISPDYTQRTIAKPLDITIEVLSAYPGKRPDIYISY